MYHLYKTKPMRRATVAVDPGAYEVLDQPAERSDASAPWLIRRSMCEFLQRFREDHAIELHPGREVV